MMKKADTSQDQLSMEFPATKEQGAIKCSEAGSVLKFPILKASKIGMNYDASIVSQIVKRASHLKR